MATEQNSLEAIAEQKPVLVFLPIINIVERYRTTCLLDKSTDTEFKLLFEAGMLPVESIDRKQSCLISVDMGGPDFSIEAKIRDIPNDRALDMVVEKSYKQLREFFRVDATAEIIIWPCQPELYADNGEPWSLQGTTINISGCGILAKFDTKPPIHKMVHLTITLPTLEPETISILARPVRSRQVAENHYETAYHFDDIAAEDRDKIIGWCLVTQRRLLHLKVQVKDMDNQ